MTDSDSPASRRNLDELAKYSGDPWAPENEYFQRAEKIIDAIWQEMIHPFIKDCEFSAVIDLAAGHGRNTRLLAPRSGRILVMDIQPGNVEACRRRFDGDRNIEYAVNNGYDMRPAEDGAFTLVYCFDAMVHFEGEVVRSYLKDTLRVLRPGGRGFFHHSNYTGGKDWRTNPMARNFMSQPMFASYAEEAGLTIVRQAIIDWGGSVAMDCLTLVEKP